MTSALVLALMIVQTAPTPAAARRGAERALPLLQAAAEGHIGKQTCFACHNQALPMLAFHVAREAGLEIDPADIREQADFVHAFLKSNKGRFERGEGTGGQVDTAGYALWTLELAGRGPDEVTAAVAVYILNYQPNVGHWRTVSNRPPSEASHFTTTYLALRALRVWLPSDRRVEADRRRDRVRDWLLRTPARDTEDRVFRLRAMKEAGVEDAVVRAAGRALAERQLANGGWPQLDGGTPDAYATGSALVALHDVGILTAADPGFRRGIAFLLRTQLPDGSWHVRSRSRPFQPYYESGFPHGKDQFISAAASGWAAAALLKATRK